MTTKSKLLNGVVIAVVLLSLTSPSNKDFHYYANAHSPTKMKTTKDYNFGIASVFYVSNGVQKSRYLGLLGTYIHLSGTKLEDYRSRNTSYPL